MESFHDQDPHTHLDAIPGAPDRDAPVPTIAALVDDKGRLAITLENLHSPADARGLDDQIKSRMRVRDLAEVYTNKREVEAMLDLVPNMFPSGEDPSNIDCTFLEPACGSGNFLAEILRRKLAFITPRRHGRGEHYEHRILRCLASIYAIDISADNVEESRDRLRGVINSHLDRHLGSALASSGFLSAAEAILNTNVIRADALADAATMEVVEYHPGQDGTFTREWFRLDSERRVPDLFAPRPARDQVPVHYSKLSAHPQPIAAPEALERVA